MARASSEQGFLLGLAFWRGFDFGEQKRAALDSREKWITVNGTHVKVDGDRLTGRVGQKIEQAGKNAKGWGKRSVRPQDLPTLAQFVREKGKTLQGAGQAKVSALYIRHLIDVAGTTSVVCNGEYQGSPIVATFTGTSVNEIVSHLNPKSVRALPYIFDVLETGTFLGVVPAPKESHHRKGIKAFGYFRKAVTISGEPVVVQVDVALMAERETPSAKPYVIGTKKEGSELTYPLNMGGLSSKPSHGEDSLQSLLGTNITRNPGICNFVPVRVRVVD